MLIRLLIAAVVAALLYWGVSAFLPLLTLPAAAKQVVWILFIVIGGLTALFYVLSGVPSSWNWRGPNPPA